MNEHFSFKDKEGTPAAAAPMSQQPTAQNADNDPQWDLMHQDSLPSFLK